MIFLLKRLANRGVLSASPQTMASFNPRRKVWPASRAKVPRPWVVDDGAGERRNECAVFAAWHTSGGAVDPAVSNPPAGLGMQMNQFGFNRTGINVQVIVVAACANLRDWQPMQTNAFPGGSAAFSGPQWADLNWQKRVIYPLKRLANVFLFLCRPLVLPKKEEMVRGAGFEPATPSV